MFIFQLLEKDAAKRLGSGGCPHGDICDQTFFKKVNFEKLERKECAPPYKPKLVNNPFITFYFHLVLRLKMLKFSETSARPKSF